MNFENIKGPLKKSFDNISKEILEQQLIIHYANQRKDNIRFSMMSTKNKTIAIRQIDKTIEKANTNIHDLNQQKASLSI